jgi:hypothetical protein
MNNAGRAIAVASKRISSENSGKVGMTALLQMKGWRSAIFADSSATSPFPGDHRAALGRLAESAKALVLMRARGWRGD